MKEKGKSSKKFVRLAFILLIVIALAVGAWKARSLINLSDAKINLFKKMPARTQNIYSSYSVDIQRASSGVYYVKLKNLICDAAQGLGGTPHYFRMDLTFETADEKTAELLKDSEKELTAVIRSTTKDLQLRDGNAEKIMVYIKEHAKRLAERMAGRGAVQGIYFESFLSM